MTTDPIRMESHLAANGTTITIGGYPLLTGQHFLPDDGSHSLVICESLVDSLYTIPTISEATNADGYHTGRLLVSVADRINRNNRVYPANVWRREVANARTKIREGRLTGQAEHPSYRPELLDTIIRFTDIIFDESSKAVYADFIIIPTTRGKDFLEIAKAKVAIGDSTRGSGSVKKEMVEGKEVSVIQDDYELLGIDVMLFGEQSVEAARLLQFEHIEWPQQSSQSPVVPLALSPTEPPMPKIETIAALREAYPDLLQQAVDESTTPLDEAVQKSLATLEERDQRIKVLEEKVTALEADHQALQTAHQAALVEAQTNKDKADALRLIFEKAQTVKVAPLLVARFLIERCVSPAQVETEFQSAVHEAARHVEQIVIGQGVLTAKPEDASSPQPPNSPPPAAQTVTTPKFPTVLAVASGVHPR